MARTVADRIVSETVGRRQRIPPGQYRTDKFPVLDLGLQPPWDPKAYRLKVWGEVEQPTELSWDEFKQLPHVRLLADFHCVTRWSRLELNWEGVHVREILRRVRPKASAKAVMAHCLEGYTTNVLLSDLDDDDVILADTLEGEPLPQEHGGPLRLLVPKLYGWKSAKFLTGLEFLKEDEPGYWEQRGYHMRGEYLAEQRYW
jgi:DMSO/TMAO reductase YedYZ molybdopterin-dependent catalytic subunit